MQTIPIDIISNSHTIPMTPEQIRVVEAVSPSVALKRVSEGLVVTVHDIHGEKSETVYDGVKGDPGPSPTAKVVKTENGAVITVTDAEGTTTAEISNGREGDPGQSPTAKVTETENGAVISVTDAEGTTTAEISNGQDGVSPTISVTDITGGHRVTITDTTGAHSFDVMDGESGTGAVQDVQVAGMSVLSDGVANVPLGSNSALGVVKGYGGTGVSINNAGTAFISQASDTEIKAGTYAYKPIVPTTQHTATFYGLAKAAGSDEKNSTLPVGQYTESAKTAIKSMLGAAGTFVMAVDLTLSSDVAHGSQVVCPLPEKTTHVFMFVDIKTSTSTTTLTIEFYNSAGMRFYYDIYGGQISTSEKIMLIDCVLVDDYMIFNYNTDNASSQTRRKFISLDTSKAHEAIDEIRFNPYNDAAAIPAGSKFIIFVC